MTEDEIKEIEMRGYSKGYQAGIRRMKREQGKELRRKEQQAFLDRAFISALTACIDVQGWRHGDKPITNIPMRVELAADFAKEALKQRPLAR
jgi:hypothetical protein